MSLPSPDQIHALRIHPGIGIARLGDSPDMHYIGPEAPGWPADPEDGFKDAQGRIKRQAARFRIYAYDAEGKVLGEVSAKDADIEWHVHLCNRKAAAPRFVDRFEAAKAKKEKRPLPRRNPGVDERSLVNDPGPRTITGTGASGPAFRFDTGTSMGVNVPLGELRTDEDGHLLVLGGHGHSDSPTNRPIVQYANNDGWFDDTSDGPVTATVTWRKGGTMEAETAWVLVAPPKFAPAHQNLVTLYDVMAEVAQDKKWIQPDPGVSFVRDIHPILQRGVDYAWVNGMAQRGHGPGMAADFDEMYRRLADPKDVQGKVERQRIFAALRDPAMKDDQANYSFMPLLSGDGGDAETGKPRTWLSVLPSQHKQLKKWSQGDFKADWDGPPQHPAWDQIPLEGRPAALDRAALEWCVGGPFYPGIEMTYICLDPATYAGAFRIDPGTVPGGITQHMALPWQADFYECNTHWWPAARPDDVVPLRLFEEAVHESAKVSAKKRPDFIARQLKGTPWTRGFHRQGAGEIHRSKRDDTGRPRPPCPPSGDDDMVRDWSRLGFVVPRTLKDGRTVFVETERAEHVGLDYREAYYKLLNISAYPEYTPRALELAHWFMAQSWKMQDEPDLPDNLRFFEYSESAFGARLDAIYNELIQQGLAYDPATDPVFRTRDDVVQRVIQMAPFNQLDGVWLRNCVRGTPIDGVRALLFSIWIDEVGNGHAQYNHSNLYTNTLEGLEIYLPPVDSREYAENPEMLDAAFQVPVMELALSQFTEEFFPELLGFTLSLEWQIVESRSTIKMLEYFGIDPHFYTMHYGIDNASTGHGARARKAITLYLDTVRAEAGETAMQQAWKRIWNGFVAFTNFGSLGQDLRDKILNPPSLRDQVIAIIVGKRPYARLNHGSKKLGPNPINDWFEDPAGMLDELVRSGMLVAGNPEGSPFFRLLTFDGPMFQVFDDDEQQVLADYVRSLGKDPEPAPDPVDIGTRMVQLVHTLKDRQSGVFGHSKHSLEGPDPTDPLRRVRKTVAGWFAGRPVDLLRALADPKNGFIVPGDPDASPFLTEFLAPGRPMGQAFTGSVPGRPGLDWREVAVRWVQQGCPIPDSIPDQGQVPLLLLPGPNAVLARHPTGVIRGMGGVH